MFDFSIVTHWIDNLLRSVMPGWGALLIEFVLVGVVLLLLYAVLALFYIYFERKVCAFFQCRLGPNRVGPYGIFQSVADMFKILIKELISLNHIDKFLFNLAPYLVIVASMLAFGCLPFGKGLQVIDFNIGVFFLIAVSSIGVLGILLAGWSSHNKYTLIGAIRSGAQMVSYELSIGLSVLTMVVFAGTMSITGIVEAQSNGWFLFTGHIPAIVAFLISVETETVYISYLEVTVVDPFRQFDNATVFLGVLHAKVPAFFAAQIIGIRAFWSAVIIINRNKTGVFIFIGGDFLSCLVGAQGNLSSLFHRDPPYI